jgi:hypothetical protein
VIPRWKEIFTSITGELRIPFSVQILIEIMAKGLSGILKTLDSHPTNCKNIAFMMIKLTK